MNYEYVCEDAGPSKWVFCPIESAYLRFHDLTKAPSRKILGKFIPDPDILWKQKLDMAEKRGGRVNVDAYKPTQAVYDLYSHWKAQDAAA